MMKTLFTVLTLALGLTVCPKTLAADDPKSERGEGLRERLAERMADLNLTDEQDTKIAEIRKEFRPKVQEAAKELADLVRDEVDKVKEILTAEQRETLKQMKEERRERHLDRLVARIVHLKEFELTDGETAQIEEIREEFHPKVEKAMNELTGILTDQQKKARAEALKEGKNRREVREALNLTEEQKGKVDEVGKELATVWRDELQKIRSVLTPEQQEKLGEFKEERRERVRDRMAHAIANYRELNLTEEQKSSISKIREEYRPKIHEACNKLRAAVRDELNQIMAVVKS